MKDLVKILKALSDENRLKIVKLLEKKELCVCELRVLLGLSQPAVSHHLKVLTNAGLIDFTKEGLFVNYRLSGGADPSAENIRNILLESLEGQRGLSEMLEALEFINREEILAAQK